MGFVILSHFLRNNKRSKKKSAPWQDLWQIPALYGLLCSLLWRNSAIHKDRCQNRLLYAVMALLNVHHYHHCFKFLFFIMGLDWTYKSQLFVMVVSALMLTLVLSSSTISRSLSVFPLVSWVSINTQWHLHG